MLFEPFCTIWPPVLFDHFCASGFPRHVFYAFLSFSLGFLSRFVPSGRLCFLTTFVYLASRAMFSMLFYAFPYAF